MEKEDIKFVHYHETETQNTSGSIGEITASAVVYRASEL